MQFEDYIYLAPGLIVGRLSAEPWLALVGIGLGVLMKPWWFVLVACLVAGAVWGATSFLMANDPYGGPLVEWMYLAALPVVVTGMVGYLAKRFLRQDHSSSAGQ